MKKFWTGVACGLMMLGVSWMAQAITIYGGSTDVGGLDTILTSTKLGNSGGPDVANWLTDAIGTNIKAEDIVKVSTGAWLPTSDPSAWAYGLQTEDDGVFFIKTGDFTFNEKRLAASDDVKLDALADHFLYKNLDSMNWAVVSIGSIVNRLDAKIVELFGYQKYSIKVVR